MECADDEGLITSRERKQALQLRCPGVRVGLPGGCRDEDKTQESTLEEWLVRSVLHTSSLVADCRRRHDAVAAAGQHHLRAIPSGNVRSAFLVSLC